MKANKVVLAALNIFFLSPAIAGNMGNIIPETLRPVATLSAGPSWAEAGKTQTIFIQPSLPQAYVAKLNTEVLGSGEIFLGLQRDFMSFLHAQLGLALASTTGYRLYGDVWQNGEPQFDNFSYSYKISHAHIALKTKVLADIKQFVQPYVSGSLGVGFNRAYNYVSTPKIFEVLPEPPFAPYTNTAFTYTVGAGLQKSLDNHWSIGVGYEFADWGSSHLGAASTQQTNRGLQLSHLYTNQLQFNLSFVA